MDRKIESTIIWLFELLALGRSLGPDQEDALARYGDMYYSSCEDHDEPCSFQCNAGIHFSMPRIADHSSGFRLAACSFLHPPTSVIAHHVCITK